MRRFFKNKKSGIFLIIIISLAIFFRFYKLYELQYFSPDDEFMALTVSRIVKDHKPILVSANITTGVSLGALFWWLSAPIYWLTNFDPVKILAFGSLLGVFMTLMMYFVGKEFGGERVGLISSFLYAVSFLAGLTDRRWWPLSLDPLLVLVSLYSLYQIAKGKLRYSLSLAIAASFAWQADPSLAIVSIAALLTFLVFRVRVFDKKHLLVVVYLMFSLLPFLVFEFRHPGAISRPIQVMSERFLKPKEDQYDYAQESSVGTILDDFGRSMFAAPNKMAEEYLAPYEQSLPPFLSPFSQVFILVLGLFPAYLLWRKKIKDKTSVVILYIFLLSFLAGSIAFNLLYKHSLHQHYYVVVWPVVFILMSMAFDYFLKSKNGWVVYGILLMILVVNLQALVFSRVKYPLHHKMQIVEWSLEQLTDEPFAYFEVGKDRYLNNLSSVFSMGDRLPQNESYYWHVDWLYRAYSLYRSPLYEDSFFRQAVVVYPVVFQVDLNDYEPLQIVDSFVVGEIKTSILKAPIDNVEGK